MTPQIDATTIPTRIKRARSFIGYSILPREHTGGDRDGEQMQLPHHRRISRVCRVLSMLGRY
jgi:hypothetical protein